MISSFLVIMLILVILAAGLWVLDLVLAAVINRLGIPDDIKLAARAVIAFIVFVLVLLAVLRMFNFLPAGWW